MEEKIVTVSGHRGRSKINREYIGIYFILPFLIAVILFKIVPIVYTFFLSLTSWNGMTPTKTFVGYNNYVRLINDKIFYKSIFNTLIIWFLNIGPRMIVGLLCAVVFAQSKLYSGQFFKAVFYFPNLVNASSVAVLAYLMLDWQSGFLNKSLLFLGIISEPLNWLGIPIYTQSVVAFLIWWMWFGYSAILFTTGILGIPEEIMECAIVDGANVWKRFWKITMPLLRPTFTYVFITSLIGGLQNFDIPRVLTDGLGSPDKSLLTTVMHMYNLAFKSMQYGYGSTYAFGLFVVVATLTGLNYQLINRRSSK